jgi:predicted RNA binding protein YcfA (HicA-like mRNA interferase family)
MTQWPSVKAKKVLSALIAIGWSIKRQSGSHRNYLALDTRILYLPFMMEKKSDHECLPE